MTRRRPSETRRSLTHHFAIHAPDGEIDGYVTAGLYPDGTPAEIFLVISGAGDIVRGFARCFAICFSVCLQYGVPLADLVRRFKFFRFPPSGFTSNPAIPSAASVPDYVARWLEATFTSSVSAKSIHPASVFPKTTRHTKPESPSSRGEMPW